MRESVKDTGARKVSTGVRVLLWLLASPVLALLWLWTSIAIHYSNLPWPWSRTALAWTVFVGGPAALALLPKRRRTLLVLGGVFALVAVWFTSIQASNDRDWRPEVAVIPDARFEGDTVHVANVRNFDYRTPEDYDIRYEDRSYDLTKLAATDIIICYWDGNTDIAHTMLSFDFGGNDVLCLSVEVRREKEEGWGGLPGAFKQFEIIYVLADERDLVRLRTNYRKEEVFLFRMKLTPAESRLLLEDILARVHDLNEDPIFYRTLGRNCTTSLVQHMNEVWPDRVPLHRRLLMNGLLPEYSYERGTIRNDIPLAEVMELHRVDDYALEADDAPDFSRRIRAHILAGASG
jgi:hypothetical protein